MAEATLATDLRDARRALKDGDTAGALSWVEAALAKVHGVDCACLFGGADPRKPGLRCVHAGTHAAELEMFERAHGRAPERRAGPPVIGERFVRGFVPPESTDPRSREARWAYAVAMDQACTIVRGVEDDGDVWYTPAGDGGACWPEMRDVLRPRVIERPGAPPVHVPQVPTKGSTLRAPLPEFLSLWRRL